MAACILLILCSASSAFATTAPVKPKHLVSSDEIISAGHLCIEQISETGISSKALAARGWVGAPVQNPRYPDAKGISMFVKGKVLLSTVAPSPIQPSTCVVAGQIMPGEEKMVSARLIGLFPLAKLINAKHSWKRALQLDDNRILLIANNRVNPNPEDPENGGIMLTALFLTGQMRDAVLQELKEFFP